MAEDPMHLLLVEDEKAHAELIRRAFEPQGEQVEITVARTLREARERLAAALPDLAIIDLFLPDGSGLTLLEGEPDERRFPVVVTTSRGDEEVAVEAIKAGALQYVVKSAAALADMPNRVEGALRQWHDIVERRRAEEETRRLRNLLTNTIDSMPSVIVGVDLEGRVTHWNREAERVTGVSPEEAPGRKLSQVFPHLRGEMKRVWRAIRTERVQKAAKVALEVAGEARICEVTVYPLITNGVAGAVLRVDDVTERVRLEEMMLQSQRDLRDSEERYRSLVANLPVGIYRATPEGRFITANPALANMFGYDSVSDVVAVELPELHADADQWRTFSDQLLTEGKVVGEELRMRKQDGTSMWSAITAHVVRDLSGEVRFIDGLIEDVTARKRAEADLQRLAMAIEQASEVVFITDTEGRITYANPAFEAVTGYLREEVIGRNPRILSSGEHDPEFFRDLWTTIGRGHTWSGRIVNRRKDGLRYTVETTISPIRSAAGEIVSYVAVNHDITAELSLEAQLQQAQKMESIGRLAGGLAHDFNNLLFPILGYVQMLLSDAAPDDPRREYLLQIQEAGQRARDLNRQLLAFSRKQVLTMENVSVGEVVGEFENILRRTIREDIDLEVHLSPDVGSISADRSQLEQILMNLAVNAQDAMPHGGKLTIEAANVELDKAFVAERPGFGAGPHVRLVVRDTGCGMGPEIREKIFEPFFTTKRPGEGTGLGLATVHGIVKQHEGSIWVRSEPGQGTTFEIFFPREEGFVAEAEPPAVRRRPDELTGTETILVVEDDAAVRKLVCAILERNGYQVIEARDADECLRLIADHPGPVDLLLTDVVMPQMDGHELFLHLSASRPNLRVLYMSGYTDDVVAGHKILADDSGFIQKPVTVEELTAKVRDVLDRQN